MLGCLGLLFVFVLPFSVRADFDFSDEDFDEQLESFDITEVENLGAHTHYHCTSERIATLQEGKKGVEHKPEQLKKARAQFDIIYSETYDVPLQNMYGILEDEPTKKWFLLYGSYNELDYKKRWIPRNFDVHSMVKIPGPILQHQLESPMELDTPFDYQAGLTQAHGKKPWASPKETTVIYAGGTVPLVGQFDGTYLMEYEDVLHETDTTYVVFKAPLEFAIKKQKPQFFNAEIYTLYKEGYSEVRSAPLVHMAKCYLQKDNIEEADLKSLLDRSQTFDIESHFSDDWDLNETGGVFHRQATPSADGPATIQALLSSSQTFSLFWAMAETLSDPNLQITDHKLLSWQRATVVAGTLLSYALLRGQGALLVRSTQSSAMAPVPLFWQGHKVPSHDEFSLEQVRHVAESLQRGGEANVLETSAQFPEALLIYSLEVFEAVRRAQALEWQKSCPNPSLCS